MILKYPRKKKDEFKDYCKAISTNLVVDLSVIVLNDLYWPLSKQTDLRLAQELIQPLNTFEEYYHKENDKKKLTWLYNQGNCFLAYVFPAEKGRKKKVELSVSCIQTCILLLFNEQNQYRFENIREALGITVEMLKYAIAPLVAPSKQRILGVKTAKKTENKEEKEEENKEENKEEGGEEGGDEEGKKTKGKKPQGAEALEPDDVIVLLPLKNVLKKRIQYPAGSSVKLKMDDSKKLRDKTNEERIIKIELSLVRVMKSRNVMNIQELIAEATAQLCKYFRPDPKIVKRRIENLMERGFMRRDEENQRTIHYCA